MVPLDSHSCSVNQCRFSQSISFVIVRIITMAFYFFKDYIYYTLKFGVVK